MRAGPRGNEEMLRLVRPENRLNSHMKVMPHETIPLIFQIEGFKILQACKLPDFDT